MGKKITVFLLVTLAYAIFGSPIGGGIFFLMMGIYSVIDNAHGIIPKLVWFLILTLLPLLLFMLLRSNFLTRLTKRRVLNTRDALSLMVWFAIVISLIFGGTFIGIFSFLPYIFGLLPSLISGVPLALSVAKKRPPNLYAYYIPAMVIWTIFMAIIFLDHDEKNSGLFTIILSTVPLLTSAAMLQAMRFVLSFTQFALVKPSPKGA